jgi:F1F0 ATPase subunit 2
VDNWGNLLLAVLSGVGLGGIYFGGLWLSVRRVARLERPALFMIGSFVLRTMVVLIGFYLIMDGQSQRLLAALAGFALARVVLVRALSEVSRSSLLSKPER